MEDRCELTELLKSQCSHCRKDDSKLAPWEGEVAHRFEAQFNGRGECGHLIVRGDWIGRLADNGYLCERCTEGTP